MEATRKKISLLAGYILLAAVGDDIIKTKKPVKRLTV